ncbi:MAG: hypothetical protein K2H49_02675, partial [Muribaculaceae bacterium]|nr:hypothetical protein [Muribaculaceae bacterium]
MKKSLLFMAGMAVAGTAIAGWGNSNEVPVAIFPHQTSSYATEVKACPDGSVWAMMYHPNTKDAESEYDTSHVVYEYIVQHFDKDGNPGFDGLGMVISDYSNYSYTVINNYMIADSEGNAIVAVQDCRNSSGGARSYTAYKVAPDGTLLWGEDGVPISDPVNPADGSAAMRIVELEDGSFVFAWLEMSSNTTNVCLQRISKDGKPQWNLDKMRLDEDFTTYPYLVNSGDNTFILVYARSSSQVLYARKIDFEGESVWSKDVRIYRGGWGSTPIHTQIEVAPSGDGGVLVAWTDDRNAINLETPYLSYVTPDGELGFKGQSDESDAKLFYTDTWRSFQISTCAAEDGSGFYVTWRITSGNQGWQGMMMQKVSKEGDLLWGDDAKVLFEPVQNAVGYTSLLPNPDGGATAFFMEQVAHNVENGYAARFNADGEFVWDNGMIPVTIPGNQASSLKSQPYGEDAYLLNWVDGMLGSVTGDNTYVMTILKDNGTFGVVDSAVKTVSPGSMALDFDGRSIIGNIPDGSKLSIYSAAGVMVAETVACGGHAPVNL